MIRLRDYQIDAVSAVYEWMRHNAGNPVCVAPTGSGKAVLIARICRDAWQAKRRVIVLAHVKELLEQEADKLQRICPDLSFGVYSAGLESRDTSSQILVAGIQSVYNKARLLGGFDLVIIDEAHRVSTKQEGIYRSFLRDLKEINPDTRLLGFTATPYRTGEGTIYGDGRLFDDIAYEIDILTLIQQGYLSPLVSKSGLQDSLADYDALHIERGDFVTSEVESLALDTPRVWAACRDVFEQTADRKSVLIFAVSVRHAEKIREILGSAFDAECGLITGSTPPEERAEIQRRFRDQSLKFLVNVNVLTTGFDAPATDCVALMRPTASPVLYVQMVGRGFRIAPGKKNCLVLDFGGNVMRHGPITGVSVRQGKSRRRAARGSAEPAAPAMKTCPNCCGIIENWYFVCPDCGYEWPIHDARASDADIMTGKAKPETAPVWSVRYSVHQKRGDAWSPLTMRVDYEIGFGLFVSEWVCPEHSGYPLEKFCQWWEKRCAVEPPETAAGCVALADAGLLAVPKSVTYVQEPGKRYKTVRSVELGQVPDPEAGLAITPTDVSARPERPASPYSELSQYSDLEF